MAHDFSGLGHLCKDWEKRRWTGKEWEEVFICQVRLVRNVWIEPKNTFVKGGETLRENHMLKKHSSKMEAVEKNQLIWLFTDKLKSNH